MAELKCFKVFGVVGHGKRLCDFDIKVHCGRFSYVGDDERANRLAQAIILADSVKWSFDEDRPGNNVSVIVTEDSTVLYEAKECKE